MDPRRETETGVSHTCGRRFRKRHGTRWLPALLPPVAILVLAAPLLFTSRSFGPDWTIHLWYLWKQSLAMRGWHAPTLFMSADLEGVLFPHFAFYGGTIYALGGALANGVGGDPTGAYVLTYLASFGVAYAGTTWLSRQAGLRGWRSQCPALVLVTAAYYLTNLYGRGAWGEFTATSAIPLLVASGLSLLTAEHWRPLPAFAFVLAVVLFAGSHNITLLWGSVFLVGLAFAAVVALPRRGREVPRARLLGVLGLGALGIGVNLWFLLPDVAYASRTLLSGASDPTRAQPWFGSAGNLFDPFRAVPNGRTPSTPAFYVQLPDLVLLWLAAALKVTWRRLDRPWRRLRNGLIVIFAAALALVMFRWPWEYIPSLLREIQFPIRLTTFVLFAITGLVILALRGLEDVTRDTHRFFVAALAGALLFSGVLAVWQVWATPSTLTSRDEVFASPTQTPPSVYDTSGFRDGSATIIRTDPGRTLTLDPRLVRNGGVDITAAIPAGPQPIATNIAAGAYLLNIRGLRPVGRTRTGFLVVRREPNQSRGLVRIHVGPVQSGLVQIGRYGSVASVLGLVLVLGVILYQALRGPRRRQR